MQKHDLPRFVPDPGDIFSRDAAREAIRRVYSFLYSFLDSERKFRSEVIRELSPLYGESDYSPVLIANGASATVTITVPSAQLGYVVDFAYDKSLQGLQATAYVSAENTVKVELFNNTGGGVTLTAGRFRIYCWGRQLSS